MVRTTGKHTLIRGSRVLCGTLAAALLWGTPPAFADKKENTLLVWAGDQDHQAPDFVAVVDFDPRSSSYGKVLRTVPLSGTSAVRNEPHHVGLSSDGKTLALGGLLSILNGNDEVFFFDVTDPRNPTFLDSDDPPNASITDEFAALKNGGFLATFMGGANGAHPGRVVEYDADLKRLQEWPLNPPTDGFNPHGISLNEAKNIMVTGDFICPLLTLHIDGGHKAHLRGSIRVWDLAARTITRTILVGDPASPAGTMEVQLIPKDSRLRAFTAGMADGKLYLVDTQNGTATAVFDFSSFAVPNVQEIWPQIIRINKKGTRLFITLNYAGAAGKVVMFDISRPEQPKVLSVVDLGPGSGPHYLGLTRDEKRLVVTDYFLVEDLAQGGIVQAEGDHKIHVLNVHGERLERDAKFDLDFNRDISTGAARPHGVVLLRAPND